MDESEDGRFDVAARVSRTLHDRGFDVLELRHEVPTLERVFLERTRMAAISSQDEAPVGVAAEGLEAEV